MRKLKALFLALCFIIALLIFNIPRINFGYGSGFIPEPKYENSVEEHENNVEEYDKSE
jgi:hypothetical protein